MGLYVGVWLPVKSNIGLPVVGAKVGVDVGLIVGVPVFPSGNVGSSVGGFVGWVLFVGNIEGFRVGRIEGLLVEDGSMAEVVGDWENGEETGLGEVGATVGDNVCLSEGDDVGILVDGFPVVGFRGVGSLVVGFVLIGLLDVGLLVGCSLGTTDGQQKAWATNIIVHMGSSDANVEE